jgi:hypothetical protein
MIYDWCIVALWKIFIIIVSLVPKRFNMRRKINVITRGRICTRKNNSQKVNFKFQCGSYYFMFCAPYKIQYHVNCFLIFFKKLQNFQLYLHIIFCKNFNHLFESLKRIFIFTRPIVHRVFNLSTHIFLHHSWHCILLRAQ